MPQWLSHRQALELISYICAEQNLDGKNKALSDIYTIAHSLTAGECFKVHKDWRDKWAKVYQTLKKDKYL